MSIANNHPGNLYISFILTIPDGTTDYHLQKEQSSYFPDWNADWKDRMYFDRLVIKNLTEDISIKFHSTDYTSFRITEIDSPAVIEPFVFRDIYISNTSGKDATFDITLFSGAGISAPPLKPTELTATAINSSTIDLTFLDNATTDEYYYVERSTTSASSGFSEIDNFRVYGNRNQYKAKERTYSDTTCSPSTQYWYRIRAYKGVGGFSPYSNVATATTPA